jgi:hypothetical protein
VHERVDRAARIGQRRLRRRPGKLDLRQPRAVAVCPRRPVLEAHVVAQQQLRQAVTAAHQIDADSLARTDEVTQRFFLGARDTHRMQLARQQQPDEMLGVTAIGLHLIAGRTRDLARCRDDAVDLTTRELAR